MNPTDTKIISTSCVTLWVFHLSSNGWLFTGIWVTANLLRFLIIGCLLLLSYYYFYLYFFLVIITNIIVFEISLLLFASWESFSHQLTLTHRCLSYCKSPQVTRTLLSILADLNNSVVWLVSGYPLISRYSSSFINLLEIVPSAQPQLVSTSPSWFIFFLVL